MANRSQAEVEDRLYQQLALVDKGTCNAKNAFGPVQDWMVELGDHKILLSPGQRRWLFYNRITNAWTDTGYGPSEILFIPTGKSLAAKKIPLSNKRLRPVSEEDSQPLSAWYIYSHKGKLCGPILEEELRHQIADGALPADVLVFSAAMTEWQCAAATDLVKLATISKPKLPTSLTCPKCRAKYVTGDHFCTNCGINITKASQSST